jgi:RsiW-degrading membrane proteinase PrsW (M82 family)
MLVIAVLFLVILGASVLGLRTAGGGPRWPFLVVSTLSGGALLALVMATVIALTAGRDTWNGWVSGSQSSETVTLWVVLIVGPVLLATCLALLIVGAVLRTR